VGHESGDFRFSEEIASGAAYEGRTDLGNTKKGDGVRFKGRGLIQITGRSNYTEYGKARHRDYVTEPHNRIIANNPAIAVDVSCWFWKTRNLNALADADNIDAITRRINGGVNGLKDRKAHFRRAKCLLVLLLP
jgi:putative chitinase